MTTVEISAVELLALKKLALICHALAMSIKEPARREQLALTSVLADVIARADARKDRET